MPEYDDGKTGTSSSTGSGSTSTSTSTSGGDGSGWGKFMEVLGWADGATDSGIEIWNLFDTKNRREHELYMTQNQAQIEAEKSKRITTVAIIAGALVAVTVIVVAIMKK